MTSGTGTFHRNPKALIFILVAICALVLGIGGFARKSANDLPTRSNSPRVQNKTRAFEVKQIRHDEGRVELGLKNGYKRNITAFAVSVNRLISQVDFLYSELEDQIGIAPEEVYTSGVSFARSNNPAVAAQENLDIRVLAVVFDDKTSDGDPSLVAEILNMRQGSKIQLTRIIGLVNKALTSLPIIDDTAFDKLRSQISSLPTDSQSSTAESTSLRGEKDAALRRLDQIVHSSSQSAKKRIRRLKETCENLFARL